MLSIDKLSFLSDSINKLDNDWQNILLNDCGKQLSDIDSTLQALSKKDIILPPQEQIFKSLELTGLNQIKIVILGQDPYHGPGQANGLAFAVNSNVSLPPSLQNIFKEINAEYNPILQQQPNRNLLSWANQGVLMLNATLTVIQHKANSLANIGWQNITDTIIQAISSKQQYIVFILWGNFARQKARFIDRSKHLILESAHPSPLSAYNGFFGCNHFIKANKYLRQHNKSTINWLE